MNQRRPRKITRDDIILDGRNCVAGKKYVEVLERVAAENEEWQAGTTERVNKEIAELQARISELQNKLSIQP